MEELVKQRELELHSEKKQVEDMLYSILPRWVVCSLASHFPRTHLLSLLTHCAMRLCRINEARRRGGSGRRPNVQYSQTEVVTLRVVSIAA